MVFFQTKSPNFGQFWRVLQWKMLVCIFCDHYVYLGPFGIFLAILYICWLFGIFTPYLLVIWYICWLFVIFVGYCYICCFLVYFWLFSIFSRFGLLYQEKSGNLVFNALEVFFFIFCCPVPRSDLWNVAGFEPPTGRPSRWRVKCPYYVMIQSLQLQLDPENVSFKFNQGDRIGRSFDILAVVFFGHFYEF
jgi:hypothetical protein